MGSRRHQRGGRLERSRHPTGCRWPPWWLAAVPVGLRRVKPGVARTWASQAPNVAGGDTLLSVRPARSDTESCAPVPRFCFTEVSSARNGFVLLALGCARHGLCLQRLHLLPLASRLCCRASVLSQYFQGGRYTDHTTSNAQATTAVAAASKVCSPVAPGAPALPESAPSAWRRSWRPPNGPAGCHRPSGWRNPAVGFSVKAAISCGPRLTPLSRTFPLRTQGWGFSRRRSRRRRKHGLQIPGGRRAGGLAQGRRPWPSARRPPPQ